MKYDPIVMCMPSGEPYGGVFKSLGSQLPDLGDVDRDRIMCRTRLRWLLERSVSHLDDFASFDHFRNLADDIRLRSAVGDAYHHLK